MTLVGHYFTLYQRENRDHADDAERMATRLEGLGLFGAARQVRRHFCPEPLDDDLRALMLEVERADSGDHNDLSAAVSRYRLARGKAFLQDDVPSDDDKATMQGR